MNKLELSNRMKAVTAMLPDKNNCVADIGCDHAYVSIYLKKQGIAERVIAMDVRKGPLEIARRNVKQYEEEAGIELRLSNGLEKLQPNEVNAIVIAGMGGPLIRDILAQGWSKIGEETVLVLQPQSDIRCVREFLQEKQFTIEREEMLCEDGKYYTIMRAAAGEAEQYGEVELLYGKELLQHKHPVLKEYLQKQQTLLQELRDRLLLSDTPKAMARLEEVYKELKGIEEALQQYDMQ